MMLDLNKRLVPAAPHEKEALAGMIDAADREIDGLRSLRAHGGEEIAVVEGAA